MCHVPRAQEADGPPLPLSYTGRGTRTDGLTGDRTRVAVSLKPLPRHLLLKRRRAALTAETVRLPADDLRHRRPSRNEDPAHWILYHLILALRESAFSLSAPEFPEGATEQEIEDDQEDEDEDYSIHGAPNRTAPQSYGDDQAAVNIPAGRMVLISTKYPSGSS